MSMNHCVKVIVLCNGRFSVSPILFLLSLYLLTQLLLSGVVMGQVLWMAYPVSSGVLGSLAVKLKLCHI